MKIVMAVIGFGLLLVGCGQGPAIVTVKDVNSSETITQAKAEESIEAKKLLPKDIESLKTLAEQGDANAQYNLGMMYNNGTGVEQDFKEAVKWYRKAAEQGDAEAQSNLGLKYDNGEGVEQDFKEAAKWYRKPAEQGQVYAQSNLGVIYAKGKGVDQDFKEALKWWQKAADQGDVNAQYNLGRMYKRGEGVKEDHVSAYTWWNIAATNGDKDANGKKGLIAEAMTLDQIAKAEALVKGMIKKNPKLLQKKE